MEANYYDLISSFLGFRYYSRTVNNGVPTCEIKFIFNYCNILSQK